MERIKTSLVFSIYYPKQAVSGFEKMCGVIGLISEKDVSRDLFVGMLCLQHRGQDSAGILTYQGKFHSKKGVGYVENIFSEKDLKSLKGKVGLGHTRYPTVGSDFARDAQPLFLSFPTPIGIVHNGNVTNYFDLRKEFRKKKRALNTGCDVEPILRVLGEELMQTTRLKKEHLFEAVKGVFNRVKGAYSVVSLVGGHGLLAFRDQHAIKPLVFGERNIKGKKAYGFASETIALSPLGFTNFRSVKPGEAIFIDKKLNVHSKVFAHNSSSHCMFEWVYFARAESVLDGMGVYHARRHLGHALATLWEKTGLEADVVFPVPDTSRTAATIVAERLGLPYREGLIKNRYIGRTFIMASQKLREDKVKLKLNPVVSEIEDKRILLVDDSIVRGTTSKNIVRLLKENGAKKVYLLITCPPIKFPCFYGIDFPTKSELIASKKSVEEIEKFIGADRLLYMTMEGLKDSLRTENLCTACLGGKYPVPVPESVVKQFEVSRTKERKKQ